MEKDKAGTSGCDCAIGMQVYRGNTISYIYDKCANYGKQFDSMQKELGVLKSENEVLRSQLNTDGTKKSTAIRDAVMDLQAAIDSGENCARLSTLIGVLRRMVIVDGGMVAKPNPALENVLAKLRKLKLRYDMDECSLFYNGHCTDITTSDLRRWVESEKPLDGKSIKFRRYTPFNVGDAEVKKEDFEVLTECGAVDSIVIRYHELLMAVNQKFPNESRHHTALRYIQEREAAATTAMAVKS
jgi:hypothetical protein